MAPVDNSPAKQNLSSFELICSLKAENYIPVHKYRSKRTGLTVLIADVEGPTVNGYFCLATETFSDDGLPHTLEHLIFLGSEKYPYKGVLDLLANRCLARGTNAWTDVDHTCYTIFTAGSEGFLSLMPIYLEHILYPTLTEHAFVTEVHHVTGEGEDAGVVYCEIQGRENSGESRVHLEMTRAIYPGKCGYSSETGGVMKNLRESTTNQKCRDFHKYCYRPDNLTVIIAGPVQPHEVFKALQDIEDKIVARGPLEEFERPWQSPVPRLEESVEKSIRYPCDDEDNGMVNIAWRGPSAVTKLYEMNACALLLKYFTDTSVSPLQKEFVEIEDPYASSIIYSLSENSESMIYIMFENVPVGKIEDIKPKLVDIMRSFADGKEEIDMRRMHTVIHRQQLERLSHLENNPHDAVAFMIIGDLLYGNTVDDFRHRLNDIDDLRRMEKEPVEFWINILREYIVEAPMVTIKAYPSVEEQRLMIEEERNRIKEQVVRLGEAGLKAKAKELSFAMENNDKPPPNKMLTSIAIPGTESINFHTIVRYTSDSELQTSKFDLSRIPLFAQLDDVKTNFVYMFILMDTSPLTIELRNYLPLLLEAMLESPIQRGNVLMPYEEVVAQLESDTVATSTRLGLDASSRFTCGPFSHTASLILQLEEDKYEQGIKWLNELLYHTVFTADRLKVLCSKIINDVAQAKRSGSKVVRDLMKDIFYEKESNVYSNSMLRQQLFLTNILEKLNDERSSEVLEDIEKVRQILTNPSNMALHLALNLENIHKKFPDLSSAWSQLLKTDAKSSKQRLTVTPDWKLMAKSISDTKKPSCVVGMGCIESSFLSHSCPTLTDFNDPDLAPLLVFLVYVSQLEGPMWKQLRGAGLTYHYRVQPNPGEGLLNFTLAKATNVTEAYRVAKNILEAQIESNNWDATLLASAKSSLIFEIIQREQNIRDVVAQSLLSYFKGIDQQYNRNLIKLIHNVTVNDLNRVGKKYVAPLFDPNSCKTTVVCNPAKVDEIVADLKAMKLNVTGFACLEDTFFNQW